MIVNICCSGSSGSTFFSTLLNRHPDIVCGEELGLFSKPIFYDNFSRLQRWHFFVRRAGISSNPYFQDRSILRNLDSFSLSKDRVWQYVLESKAFVDLVDRLKRHVLALAGKSIWAEKTPENIFTVGRFLRMFPGAKILHIVRDPRDVVLSLMARGLSSIMAAEAWLTSVAAIQNYRSHPSVLEIRYEDLVFETERILSEVCSHLKVEFQMKFFSDTSYESSGITRSEGLSTWTSKPSGESSSKSIGKYKNSATLLNDIYSMELTREFADILETRVFSLSRLASDYRYEFDDEDASRKCLGRTVPAERRGGLLRLADLVLERNRYVNRVVY
jgi:hypothetical protein